MDNPSRKVGVGCPIQIWRLGRKAGEQGHGTGARSRGLWWVSGRKPEQSSLAMFQAPARCLKFGKLRLLVCIALVV